MNNHDAVLAGIREEQKRRRDTFISEGEMFALGRDGDTLTLYEDAGWWMPITDFHVSWLPELRRVIGEADS